MLLPTVLALAAFEDMLNKALDLDPATRLQLNQQLNKSILVNVQFPHISILVFLDDGKVRLTPAEDHLSHEATATVTASSFDLIKQALNKEQVISQSGLQIEGDVFFLHELQKIAHQIDIDWEYGLSQLIGDISASQIGQGVRSLFDFAKQAANAFLNNSSQFLREDAQILPKQWQVDDYIEEVQELRSDIERLEARISLLTAKCSSPTNESEQNREGL
jgi:ubiquinone biosynthesis protein UbiJ